MKNIDFVIEKLNSKKFKKNRSYSSREISSIIGTTSNPIVQTGALKDALTIHPEWKNEYGRIWTYLGSQIVSAVPSPLPKKETRKYQRRKREVSILWGLIKIR